MSILCWGLTLTMLVGMPSQVVVRADDSGDSSIPLNVCLWRSDTGSCAWNLHYPASVVVDTYLPQQQPPPPGSTGSTTTLAATAGGTTAARATAATVGLSAKGRALLQASLHLELCHSRSSAGAGACVSSSTSGSVGSATAAAGINPSVLLLSCEWRAPPATGPLAALLAQLLPLSTPPQSSLPASPTSSIAANGTQQQLQQEALCLPAGGDAALSSLLAPYLDLTAPERCYDVATVEECTSYSQSAGGRCFYEDHFEHAHCMPEFLFVRQQLAEADSAAAANNGTPPPLAEAAQAAQHLCSPESNWADSHETRTPPLSAEACATRGGSFTLRRSGLAALAEAAGVPGAAVSMFTPSPPLSPPLPPFPLPATVPATCSECAATCCPQPSSPPLLLAAPPPPAAAGANSGMTSVAACPPPPPCSCGIQGSGGAQLAADSAAALPPPPPPPPASVLLTAPSCQLLARGMCGPTLLALGAAAAEAVSSPDQGLLAFAGTSDPGRELLAASLDALRCTFDTTSAAATADCGRTAAAASPAAAAALLETFNPPCARLSEAECAARPGCFPEPHGDHTDCKRTSRYAAQYLLRSGSSPTQQALVLAAAAQRLADVCRAGLATCGRQTLNNTLMTRGSLASLSAASLGRVAAAVAPPPASSPASGGGGDGGNGGLSSDGGGVQVRAPPPAPVASGDEHDDDDEHDGHEDHVDSLDDLSEESRPLRIAGVFVVLAAGLVGCALPWILQNWLQARPLLAACVRALSAGVILCLALVHIATHAMVEMSGLIGGEEGEEGDSHEGHDHRRRRRLIDTTHPRSDLALATATNTAAYQQRQQLMTHPVAQDLYGRGFRMLQQAAAAAAADSPLPSGDLAGLDLDLLSGDYGAEDGGGDSHASHGGGAHAHPYPIGMVIVMFGFLLMAGMELCIHAIMEARIHKRREVASAAGSGSVRDHIKGGDDGHSSFKRAVVVAAAAAEPNDVRLELDIVNVDSQDGNSGKVVVDAPSPATTTITTATPNDKNDSNGTNGGMDTIRLASMCAMFELGCVFHSFIIGLSLGTSILLYEARTLLIALSIHQFAEGISLASVLVAGGMRRWRLAAMVILYGCTAPAGIAVGIAIEGSYDSHTITARAVQGTINGVSAGLLLYLAAALIMGELAGGFGGSGGGSGGKEGGGCSRGHCGWRTWERALLFGFVCIGAGAFAVLAEWA